MKEYDDNLVKMTSENTEYFTKVVTDIFVSNKHCSSFF